jgi:alpha-glucosidase
VLTRASFAGGQRYAATWTGDNSSTWNHLRLSTAMLLNLGLSGFAHAGADVGGFVGAPSAELLTRWIQVGAFTPLFRDHTAKGTPPQEPWVHGPEHTALRRAAIEERYRLLPYLYALAEETARTGVPMMRPVFLEFPETLAAFLLGPSLLVAPQPFGEMTDAYDVILPGEGWWDYATGRVVTAARRLDDPMAPDAPVVRETPRLDRLPVFVRPGTILPRQPLVQSTAETPDGPLELRVYPGADGETTLYWDDGASLNGATLRQTVSLTTTTEGLTLSFAAREGAYPPWWREIELVVFGWDRPAAAVRLDGVEVAATAETAAGVVRVRLPDQAGPAVLRVA